MAQHYSTKNFFRQIHNALLARYCHERELFTDLDFTAMKETKPDALFDAWLTLPEEQTQAHGRRVSGHLRVELREGFQGHHRRGALADTGEPRRP